MKRSKEQILTAILQKLDSGSCRKIGIVYGCNLNFHSVNPHLDYLIDKDYITYEGGKYSITAIGRHALQVLEVAEKVWKSTTPPERL